MAEGLYCLLELEQVRIAIGDIIERPLAHLGIRGFRRQLLVDRKRLLVLFALELIDRGLTQVGALTQVVIAAFVRDLAVLGQRLAVVSLVEVQVRYAEPDSPAVGLILGSNILIFGNRLV